MITLIKRLNKIVGLRSIRNIQMSANSLSNTLFTHRDTEQDNPHISFKFSEENSKRIDSILKIYPEGHKRGAMIPLLDLAQRQYGWLPISAMNEVARILDVPKMRVYEVATFYTMFNRRPMGKYHVQVCTCTPCWLKNSDHILTVVCETTNCTIGETSADNLFSISEVECLGACANAPMMQVNDDYYEDLTAEVTVNILNSLKKGIRPPPGPQCKSRYAAEPINGLTSLTSPPPDRTDYVRSDL